MFLPEFIEIGLDVIHPIQKNTMDEREIARKYGDKICIFAGIDVQYLMAFGTTEEVEAEVKFLMDTYKSPDGRLGRKADADHGEWFHPGLETGKSGRHVCGFDEVWEI